MKIDKKQTDILRAKLNDLDSTCARCDHDDFTVVDKFFELREFESGGIDTGSATIPIVVLVCDNCGHLSMLSAMKLGLFDTSEKQVNKDAAKQE